MMHAGFLLIFMLVAAPLVSFIHSQPSLVSWWWFAGTWQKRRSF
jgi:hypothetical protein